MDTTSSGPSAGRDRPSGGLRGEGTRTALVEAAVRVVEREGVAAATTRRIAAEAGLPLGAVHYWFRDKRALLAAVVAALLDQVREQALVPTGRTEGQAEGQPEGQPEGRASGEDGGLAALHRRLAALPAERQLALFEVTTHALRDPALHHLAREQYAAYREVALAAVASWAGDGVDALPGGRAALATLLVACLDGLTLAALADGPARGDDGAVDLLLHLLRGALPPTPPGRPA
ncbi:TetR family transcriptional regulator [Quadrisphaera sp. INWT6]|uniref:TetR/AcrR family transcriptional regulator n=1 Tax=Quadrisphaera sp. INWT6 TaxID=2596917 RepID=UPI0018927CC4|nr:TetR family transcriptional regulator [Quadrisphaera sp. INWT6]